jgi:hypothetical protein
VKRCLVDLMEFAMCDVSEYLSLLDGITCVKRLSFIGVVSD